jgi:hypothetical protein
MFENERRRSRNQVRQRKQQRNDVEESFHVSSMLSAARCWLGVFLFPSFSNSYFLPARQQAVSLPDISLSDQMRFDSLGEGGMPPSPRLRRARGGLRSGEHTRLACRRLRLAIASFFFILPIVMRDSALSELDASPFYLLHFDNLNPLFPRLTAVPCCASLVACTLVDEDSAPRPSSRDS